VKADIDDELQLSAQQSSRTLKKKKKKGKKRKTSLGVESSNAAASNIVSDI